MTHYKEIDFQQFGGLPLDQQTLDFMQSSYRGISEALAGLSGDNVILSGIIQQDARNVSFGWIVHEGVLYPFYPSAHTIKDYFKINELVEPVVFEDTQNKAVYFSKYASFCEERDSGALPFAILTRLNTLVDTQAKIIELEKRIISHEGAILTGEFRLELGERTSSVSAPCFALIDGHSSTGTEAKYYLGRGGALANYDVVRCYNNDFPMKNWEITLYPKFDNTMDTIHIYAHRSGIETAVNTTLRYILIRKSYIQPLEGNRPHNETQPQIQSFNFSQSPSQSDIEEIKRLKSEGEIIIYL